ncbi:hypothetical protein E1301_Tti020848 [Triplophysa tibetana]|uniref:BESS domain-containing protein n=1 Tax=Triplophysa tibetana TaxID=1572043 RepID=A0A5A9PAQ0_9TELE|nr:hypothetical protein E1301_Tti020848 [Triplophysa tibetana]
MSVEFREKVEVLCSPVFPRQLRLPTGRGDEEASGYDQPEDQGEAAAAVEQTGSFDGSEPGSPLAEPAAASDYLAGPSTSAAVPRGPPRRRAQRTPREQPSEVPPHSEDELFLLSLVPSLQRLPIGHKNSSNFKITN